jgi:hypothetical protein
LDKLKLKIIFVKANTDNPRPSQQKAKAIRSTVLKENFASQCSLSPER